MFSGIVRGTGGVEFVEPQQSGGLRVGIETGEVISPDRIRPGASVSVDGVCLTVSKQTDRGFELDASEETLDKTTMDRWEPNRPVNLEPALQAGESIGGHFVTGHVDDTVRIEQISDRGEFYRLKISYDSSWTPFLAPKGSVTLDGISLTVNRVQPSELTVRIVPHTREVTTLSRKQPGDRMNLEVDVLARYLYNFSQYSEQLDGNRLSGREDYPVAEEPADDPSNE